MFFFCYFYTLLLSSFWTSRGHRCRPFFPPVLVFNFYRAKGSAIPLLVDFSSSVANSRSRAFRASQFVNKKKSPDEFIEYALGGGRTHETDLYQARGYPDTPPGRPSVCVTRNNTALTVATYLSRYIFSPYKLSAHMSFFYPRDNSEQFFS